MQEVNEMNRQSKYWCFTLNFADGRPSEAEYFTLADLPGATYLVYQLERGENGVYHFQGYVEFDSKKRGSTVKRLEPFSRAHLEVRKAGRPEPAALYCKKADTRVEGTRPHEEGIISQPQQGNRKDLSEVRDMIRSGRNFAEIADTDHFGSLIRYHKGFQWFMDQQMPQRDWTTPPYVLTLVGPTGVGKTRLVFENFGDDIYVKPVGKWWPGYHQQSTVLIDEMYGSRFSYGELLQLIDRYPMRVEYKGGHAQVNSSHFILTSNASPDEWYSGPNVPQYVGSALQRRLAFNPQSLMVYYPGATVPHGVVVCNYAEAVERGIVPDPFILPSLAGTRVEVRPNALDILMQSPQPAPQRSPPSRSRDSGSVMAAEWPFNPPRAAVPSLATPPRPLKRAKANVGFLGVTESPPYTQEQWMESEEDSFIEVTQPLAKDKDELE
jgi:hypothetical protein